MLNYLYMIFMIIAMKVVGIGQCSLDYLFTVDSFPEPDTKTEFLQWATAGGGPVATALVSLARLGVDCSFYGIVGDDEVGEKIIASLRSENIDIRGIVKRKDSVSQVAFIAVEKCSGKRTIFWQRPSGDPFMPSELPRDFLNRADFLLVDGLMSDISIYAAKCANAQTVPVMLDAGHVRKGMIELAGLSDYVVASEEFAKELMAREGAFNAEKAILQMKSFGAKTATITLGEKGSISISGDEVFSTPTFPVDVMDTTGAGDVFHGGYIYGLIKGWNIKSVIRFASAFAALKCTRPGGREGIPTLKEVEALLQSAP
jgi:sulfofructose kinase